MATIRYIDKEKYAAKALELLLDKREGYVNYAFGLMKEGMPQGQARELLEKKVKNEMETALFEYLKSSGHICGDVRYQYYAGGYYRRVRQRPEKRDVPSNLLDVKEVTPNYEEVIVNIMVDAAKLSAIYKIETITKEANENKK